MNERALLIKGPLKDLSELLRIARCEGKKVLKVDKIIVKPVVLAYGNESYMVVVEPDGSGCSKDSDVGGKTRQT